ncbi:6-hydroxymethylpterin diphosphokinase MptE-like protein [Oceanicoccus sp. KOV_DT_Chl]|uniref:6-hydroxymethylpterin diphosphokinase MptE-like protein n=1 Tax=Oceanicoccus sp. KOV_DT_Chl TaxID=1904639 RepID=UPI000C79C0A8|nr:6-hydroxymethylpterin diphosphokinase MptE-like protein [Oceanicoccus sp. KOV_DT_Chl]
MSEREIISVYRYAAALVRRRLMWDLHLQSWVSRKKLKSLKNLYQGKKAVILCNGPSLNEVDFDLLKNVYTFGLNKINLLFNKTDFRPSSIVAVNPLVLEQNIDFYTDTSIPIFVDSYASTLGLQGGENRVFLYTSDIPSFAKDCSGSVFQGYTVTYVALQLAYHMGFSSVALVGCDHYFGNVIEPNKTQESVGLDRWHFDKNYFANGAKWDAPDLMQSERSYQRAKDNFENNGRMLVDATSGGNLKVLKKVKLTDFCNNDID